MFSAQTNLNTVIGDFRLDRMLRYSMFVPRFYNLCKSLGFEAGKIKPARALCPDEGQGFPIIQASHVGYDPDTQTFSTARCYLASSDLVSMLPADSWPDDGRVAVGAYLVPELFSFKRNIIGDIEGRSPPEEQGTDNPDQNDLEDAILKTGREKEIRVPF